MEIHNFMKKKNIYAPPILEIFVMGAEANFCESTPVRSSFNTGKMDENDCTGLWGDPE